MPFASFKNIQKRFSRVHKERSQPEHRRHLGFLQKKQDFRKRAKDKQEKDAKIKEMYKKSLDKNKDEFYFNMHNSRFDMEKGHIPLNTEKKYADDELKMTFKQSVTYVRRELAKELSKISRLEAQTNLLQGSTSGCKHIMFAEDYDELRQIHNSLSNRTNDVAFSLGTDNEDVHHQRLAVYNELAERLERAKKLKLELAKREAKKNLMFNSKRKYRVISKGSETSAPIYQFESVRSR